MHYIVNLNRGQNTDIRVFSFVQGPLIVSLRDRFIQITSPSLKFLACDGRRRGDANGNKFLTCDGRRRGDPNGNKFLACDGRR